MPVSTLKIFRPKRLCFALEDGRQFIVNPSTRAMIREALSLDPKDDQVLSPVEAGAQRALQLAALVGPTVWMLEITDDTESERPVPSASVLDGLTPDEECLILTALNAQGHGQDPEMAVALQKGVKKNYAILQTALAISTATPQPSPSTSTPA